MVEAQPRGLGQMVGQAGAAALLHQFHHHRWDGGGHHQLPHIMQDAGHKEPLDVGLPAPGGQGAGDDTAGHAVTPEGGHAHQLRRDAGEDPHYRGGQGQITQLLGADDGDRLVDRIHLAEPAEQRTVGQPQQAGRQALVLGDDLGNVVDGGAGMVDRLV